MRKARRAFIASVVAVSVSGLIMASSASGVVSGITLQPVSQTVSSGTPATWSWAWYGSGTYTPKFSYGDGTSRTYAAQTNGGAGNASRTFSSCTNTSYSQRLTLGSSSVGATTRVNAGPC